MGFYECTSSYVASVEAYAGHYMTSQMGVFDGDIADGDFGGAMWFYGFWGLWWIHSAYPNYDLDTTYGPQTYSPAALTTNDPAAELGDLIMGNLPSFVESAYVDGSFSTSELADFLGEEELEALWSFPTPRPTPRPVSRMPSYCYRFQYYARRWPWRRSLYMRYYPQ